MHDKLKSSERRVGQVAVPDDISVRLNELQHQTLARLEGFGWSVGFVRRPLFQDEVIVLFDPTGQRCGVLREDGILDTETDLQVR